MDVENPKDDRRHLIDHFDQVLYGISDPNWGAPIIMDLTVRNTSEEAIEAFLKLDRFRIYKEKAGKPDWRTAYVNGFRVVKIKISNLSVESVK